MSSHACALALTAAAIAASSAARLVGVTFVDFGKGGDNDIAVTNMTLVAGAYALSFAPETPTNDHYGYSCVMAFRPAPAASYFVISDEQPAVRVITLDGTTGAVASSVLLSPQYIVVDMSYNTGDGLLYALASPDGTALHIVTLDARTGAVAVVDATVPALVLPRFCESGLSLSGAHPRMYFTADTNATDPDDGDQAIHTYDLQSRSIVSSVPWGAVANGSLNALAAATLPGAGAESLLAIATDPVEGGTRPLQLLSIAPDTGAFVVLGAAPLPPGSPGPLIPSLGSLALDGRGATVTTILYDDAESAYYVATWNVSAGAGALAPLAFTPVATPTAGGVWKVQWVP